jgi:hypothetical protein
MTTTLKTIEPHRRFSYDGAMLISKKNLFGDYGVSKSQPRNRLEELESQINQNFFKAAEALREIRDDKLYLVYAETFKEYCEQRLSRSVNAVYEQLKMLEIHKELQKTSTGIDKPILSEKDLSPVTGKFTSHQGKKYVKDLRKLARTPKSPKPKEIEMPIIEVPEEDERTKRWSQAMTKLRAAQNKDEEGLLEAVERMLEDWGL